MFGRKLVGTQGKMFNNVGIRIVADCVRKNFQLNIKFIMLK